MIMVALFRAPAVAQTTPLQQSPLQALPHFPTGPKPEVVGSNSAAPDLRPARCSGNSSTDQQPQQQHQPPLPPGAGNNHSPQRHKPIAMQQPLGPATAAPAFLKAQTAAHDRLLLSAEHAYDNPRAAAAQFAAAGHAVPELNPAKQRLLCTPPPGVPASLMAPAHCRMLPAAAQALQTNSRHPSFLASNAAARKSYPPLANENTASPAVRIPTAARKSCPEFKFNAAPVSPGAAGHDVKQPLLHHTQSQIAVLPGAKRDTRHDGTPKDCTPSSSPRAWPSKPQAQGSPRLHIHLPMEQLPSPPDSQEQVQGSSTNPPPRPSLPEGQPHSAGKHRKKLEAAADLGRLRLLWNALVCAKQGEPMLQALAATPSAAVPSPPPKQQPPNDAADRSHGHLQDHLPAIPSNITLRKSHPGSKQRSHGHNAVGQRKSAPITLDPPASMPEHGSAAAIIMAGTSAASLPPPAEQLECIPCAAAAAPQPARGTPARRRLVPDTSIRHDYPAAAAPLIPYLRYNGSPGREMCYTAGAAPSASPTCEPTFSGVRRTVNELLTALNQAVDHPWVVTSTQSGSLTDGAGEGKDGRNAVAHGRRSADFGSAILAHAGLAASDAVMLTAAASAVDTPGHLAALGIPFGLSPAATINQVRRLQQSSMLRH